MSEPFAPYSACTRRVVGQMLFARGHFRPSPYIEPRSDRLCFGIRRCGPARSAPKPWASGHRGRSRRAPLAGRSPTSVHPSSRSIVCRSSGLRHAGPANRAESSPASSSAAKWSAMVPHAPCQALHFWCLKRLVVVRQFGLADRQSSGRSRAGDLDGVHIRVIEDDTVVAAAETKAGQWGILLFKSPMQPDRYRSRQWRICIAVSFSMARRSARASGDQITAIRSGAASSLTDSVRTRVGSLRAGRPRRGRAKHGHAAAPQPSRA